MSGFQLPFGVKPVNPIPVDYYSGPYISNISIEDAIDQANVAIPQGIRFKTMEVRLIVNNFGLKYWYKDGIENTDLIEFVTSPSSFYIQGGTTQSYNTISDIYRTGSLTIGTSSLNSSKLYIYATQSGAFQLEDGSQGDNYILTTSGTSGVATWTSSTSPFYVQGGTTYSSDTTSNIYRTGSINIGTGTATDGRFVVSSTNGTVSLVVDENGSVYNRGRGNSSDNIAFGLDALISTQPNPDPLILDGKSNTAFGVSALFSNTLGFSNLAIGAFSLYTTTISSYNVAVGLGALFSNTSGSQNMAIGAFSLYLNGTGDRNTAIGTSALQNNTSGQYNTSIGNFSGYLNQSGTSNIFIGHQAGSGVSVGDKNVIIASTGFASAGGGITTGSNNLIIAQNNGNTTGITTGSNNTIIGKVTGLAAGLSSSVIISDGSGNIRLYVNSSGNFGLGTTSPSTKLHIYSTLPGAFRLEDGTQGVNKVLVSDTNGVATWSPLSNVGISGASGSIPKFTGESSLGNSRFSDNGVTGFYGSTTQYVSFMSGGNTWLTLTRSQASMSFILGNPQSPNFQIGQIQSTNTMGLSIESAGYTSINTGLTYSEKMRITSTGNVGIGLTAPSTKLHIFATQSGAFRLEDGTQSYPGYVLTSDANGVGTWQGNTQITLSGPTATALATWNNATIMSNFSATCTVTIPDTGLPPNFSFRFIVISSNNSATIAFATASLSQILPSTLLTFAQYESGVIDRYGTTQNYYITY
jgi:hypothetical protein